MAAQVARDVYRTILVIGGGIAGVTAAIEAAEAGYDVITAAAPRFLHKPRCVSTGVVGNACRRAAQVDTQADALATLIENMRGSPTESAGFAARISL